MERHREKEGEGEREREEERDLCVYPLYAYILIIKATISFFANSSEIIYCTVMKFTEFSSAKINVPSGFKEKLY